MTQPHKDTSALKKKKGGGGRIGESSKKERAPNSVALCDEFIYEVRKQ